MIGNLMCVCICSVESEPRKLESCLEKLSVCGGFEQNSYARFFVLDHLNRQFVNISYEVLLGDGAILNGSALKFKESAGNNATIYNISFYVGQLGTQILVLYHNGKQLANSPFRFLVTKRDCVGLGIRVPDIYGNCICPPKNYFEIAGGCVSFSTLFSSVFAPVVFLVSLAVLALHRHHITRENAMWKIDAKDLKFPIPEEELGRGVLSIVVKAELGQTPVAVKKFLHPPSSFPFSVDSVLGTGSGDKGRLPGYIFSIPLIGRTPSFGTNRIISSDDPEAFHYKSPVHHNQNVTFMQDAKHNSTSPNPDGLTSLIEEVDHQRKRKGSANDVTALSTGMLTNGNRSGLLAHVKKLVRIRHPCITTVMGVVDSSSLSGAGKYFPLLLVMELMEMGTLQDILLHKTFPLQGETALNFVQNIVKGMVFLHSHLPPIVHGDLKSSNVLIDRNFTAKITDLAFRSKDAASGTPLWMAPELLNGLHENTPASDIYSFGVVLYECMTRERPYDGLELSQVVCVSLSKCH